MYNKKTTRKNFSRKYCVFVVKTPFGSLVTTAANEHDLNQLGNLLHGEEQFVSADAGYQGVRAAGA